MQRPIMSCENLNCTMAALVREILNQPARRLGLPPEFDDVPVLVAIGYGDGRIARVNRAWTTILGHAPEYVTNRPYLELVHPEDHEATREASAQLRATGQLIYFENRFCHADGSWRRIAWWGQRHDGRLCSAGRDITDVPLVVPVDNLASAAQDLVMTADEFRKLRAACGVTQEAAASILQVSQRTVARWESGEASPNALEAESIRRRLARRIDGENRPRRVVRSA